MKLILCKKCKFLGVSLSIIKGYPTPPYGLSPDVPFPHTIDAKIMRNPFFVKFDSEMHLRMYKRSIHRCIFVSLLVHFSMSVSKMHLWILLGWFKTETGIMENINQLKKKRYIDKHYINSILHVIKNRLFRMLQHSYNIFG